MTKEEQAKKITSELIEKAWMDTAWGSDLPDFVKIADYLNTALYHQEQEQVNHKGHNLNDILECFTCGRNIELDEEYFSNEECTEFQCYGCHLRKEQQEDCSECGCRFSRDACEAKMKVENCSPVSVPVSEGIKRYVIRDANGEAPLRAEIERLKRQLLEAETTIATERELDVETEAKVRGKTLKEVEPIVSKLFEVCEHADFSNGVTAEGMDEGRVHAYRLICELKQKWELSQLKGEEGGK